VSEVLNGTFYIVWPGASGRPCPTEGFGKAVDLGTAADACGLRCIPSRAIGELHVGGFVLREWRGKTQLYISHKINIGLGYISDLENGRRKATTAALKKIANVLNELE
jgi:hypothetical protein